MDKIDGEKKDWQKICAQVAAETNPRRLSRLIEELIKALDAHRQELDRNLLNTTAINPNATRPRDPESISLPLTTLKSKLWL